MKNVVAKVFVVMSACAIGCAHEPSKPGERADLVADATSTLQRMEAKNPTLRSTLDSAVGYIVFPKVGAAGLVVGGGAGKGVIFEHGVPTGYATVEHADVGAIAGGQEFAEVVIFRDRAALDEVKHGRFDLGASTSAVLLKTGVSTEAPQFDKGVAVVIEPLRGAMVNASVGGQRIHATM